MYKEFFGLRANPFNVNPDPRYLFLTRHTEEALACLTYGIQSRKGFVLLTHQQTFGMVARATGSDGVRFQFAHECAPVP
jgi:type II secretory pathway predicted ATPase ExeA